MNNAIFEYGDILGELKKKRPLIHHITNYVTVNDCANISLAIGASPIMADAIEEVEAIVSISSALVLNIGTLNCRTVESMIAAGKKANQLNIPVIFDPVGAGASEFRNETTRRILQEVNVSVLRGNISEIRFIAGLSSNTKGVDAAEIDTSDNAIKIAIDLAKKQNCIVAITGVTDVVSNGSNTVTIKNGHQSMSNITGTGCMCTSLVGSFCAAAPEKMLYGTVAAILCMGIAGEIAYHIAGELGNSSLRLAIIDAISRMDSNTIREKGVVV